MKVHLLRIQMTETKRQWQLVGRMGYASISIFGKTKKQVIDGYENQTGNKVTHVVQYKGIMSRAEAALCACELMR